ncbi:peptidase of plants and bacteria-domain-containing protein [Clohesyomyces aquaticus]|uniref:Peptidase of plants and bacteria-domain-containing protein n=1 Tax=Clohesyomyces aquaticus TaxID=1231657 RepID=A0A1Y1ZAV8_9PLEO|nr:peptidase of plants and bacteria-domain-containing protein [Clohesyomyces aquaticus]
MPSIPTPVYFQTMSAAPQPSALPPSSNPAPPSMSAPTATSSSHETPKPHRKPLLRLELRDLSSDGSRAFLRLLHASTALEDAVNAVLKHLYAALPTHCIPPTRSVTLVLRSMGGVAYTTGLDIDDDHKEIHFSSDYINGVPEYRQKEEMQGVIVHEMVHCWQHNAQGTAPGGLIEGIADWVRLKAGYAPPHWRRVASGDWDAGYEKTGYFLEWLEKKHGSDVVRRINECMRGCKYEEEEFWGKCCGKGVGELWEEYQKCLEDSMPREQESIKGKEKVRSDSDNGQEEASTTQGAESNNLEDVEPDSQDHRDARTKARRGGNMNAPVRPGMP